MKTSPDAKWLHRSLSLLLSALLAATVFAAPDRQALALSELKDVPGETVEETPPAEEPADEMPDAVIELPMPDPLIRRDEAEQGMPDDEVVEPDVAEPLDPADVIYDIEQAPEPVRRMRALMIEAATTGDFEKLRPLLGKGVTETQVSLVETTEGPVETLKSQAGDPDGVEVLAILLDVLATGFVHVGKGTPEEMYVWPYFVETRLDTLTPVQKVELLRIVTAGDVADMQAFGGYNFYRVGISPDGQWKFFLTGD